MNVKTIVSCVGMAAAAAYAGPPQPSFTGIGYLPDGTSSAAFALSGDGATVVGWATHRDGTVEAIRWTGESPTQARLMSGLGFLPGTLGGAEPLSEAHAVSHDGMVIVGMSTSAFGMEAFRWTPLAGVEGLGDLVFDEPYGSFASGVNADGTVVVGSGRGIFCDVTSEAFFWTPMDGMIGLGTLPAGYMVSHAYDVTGDVHMIVGWGKTEEGRQAGVWAWGGEFLPLGDLPGGDVNSIAYAVSDDGSTIVGVGSGTFDQHPVMWRDGQITDLGVQPAGSVAGEAFDVSADGSVVVGVSYTDMGDQAFVWTEAFGMRTVADLLTDYGMDMEGWTLTRARAVSADGMWIAGEGFAPDGHQQGWIASIHCPVDYNNDFQADIMDFVTFQMYAQAGDPIADCNVDGVVDVLDYVCFVQAFENGCP